VNAGSVDLAEIFGLAKLKLEKKKSRITMLIVYEIYWSLLGLNKKLSLPGGIRFTTEVAVYNTFTGSKLVHIRAIK